MKTVILDPQERIDKRVVAESFSRAASRYDSVAHLQRLVARQMLDWLPQALFTKHSHEKPSLEKPLLDLGCGTGYVLEQVLQRHPDAECIGLDIAEGMLRHSRQHFAAEPRIRWLCADAENLPLENNSISVVTSNFALQWCGNLSRAFVEVHRVLQPQGRFLLTLPAEDTLWELKESWRNADPAHTHVNQFMDESGVRHAAKKSGLKIKRAALLSRCVYYRDVKGLTDELKTLGAHNATIGRSRTLTPKGTYQRMLADYETRRVAGGKLPATWRMLMLDMVKNHD